MGPRGAIAEAGSALGLKARTPFAHGLDSNPEIARDRLWRLTHAQHPPHEFGSTARRQAGILMDVHSVLLRTLKRHNLSFPGQGRMDNLSKAHT
jgi:hypothetical protein